MSDAHGITKENLMLTFPLALRGSVSISALGNAAAGALAKRPEEIGRMSIYPRIDELPEALLDILAYDFGVDWWDPNYSLEEKRRVFKSNWYVHKHMGTKAAVEAAISDIYPHSKVLEWFEYGGEPYHFRLDINITNDSIDSEKQRRVLERLKYYKNLRSHNDGITYFAEAAPAGAKVAPSVPGLEETVKIRFVLPEPAIKPAAAVRIGIATGMWETFTASAMLAAPPPKGTAIARAAASAGWQESYTTQTDILAEAVSSSAASDQGKGEV